MGNDTRRSANREGFSTMRTTNSTMKGSAPLRPLSHETLLTYFVDTSPMTPINSPPPNVRGRLVNAPMAAAPNEEMMMVRKSPAESSAKIGPKKMPDTAAKHDPMIHAQRRTMFGLVPMTSSRGGLSTTARIWTPMRARRKNT